MHKGEVIVHDETVKRLINEQFPQYAGLPLQKVDSMGTVNVIYKMGDDYCVRLPRLKWASDALQQEWKVLPVVSGRVGLALPEVVEKGEPSKDFPLSWAIYRWVPGRIYDRTLVDEMEAAKTLARFINELHSIPLVSGAPKAGRRPLRELNEATVQALTECGNDIDGERAIKRWMELLDTPPHRADPVWIHADLLKPNLIVNNGMLIGVIDFGSAGVGDPSFDVIPAWSVFSAKARDLFQRLLRVDDSTWHRAEAYALHQAALIIPYYRKSNPAFVVQARETIANILHERV